jgi:hypothetical protein
MTNVIERMPEQFREVFVEVLGQRDSSLLAALTKQDKPTSEQRVAVNQIFAREIMGEFGAEWEPSARGRLMERAIEEFWHLWPADVPL